MSLSTWKAAGCIAVIGMLASSPSFIRADEEIEEKRITLDIRSSTWIGVHAVPVSDALKLHLGIDGGMLVRHVVAESPAGEAGLEKHDILLKFGSNDTNSLANLMSAVAKQGDKPTEVTVLRKGERRTLRVVPSERPDGPVELPEIRSREDVAGLVEQLLKEGHVWRGMPAKVWTVGPGVLDEEILEGAIGEVPSNIEINVQKQGGRPAQITVKRDGEEWKVTEDNLDELPADIRPHVRKLSGKVALGGIGSAIQMRLKNIREHNEEDETVLKSGHPQFEEAIKAMRKALKPIESGSIESLRKELQEMRRELRSLRERHDEA